MPAQTVHLPNGQTYTVTPIFGGYTFKSHDLDLHHSAMPPGWTVNIMTEDEVEDDEERIRRRSKIYIGTGEEPPEPTHQKHTVSHRFTRPTLRNDSLFISSVSIPSSSDFKTPTSPTRHIAMMLWATLSWYFHKDPPSPQLDNPFLSELPQAGRPKGDWRIKIRREGIFKSRNTLPKLERMGLVTSEDSSVGTDTDLRSPDGWTDCFVSRRAFWQIDARLFLFTLAPVQHSPMPAQSPYPSRPGSPERGQVGSNNRSSPRPPLSSDMSSAAALIDIAHTPGVSSPGGPFTSGSHLPTYYPAPPTQYTFSNYIRHPIRPKPPRQSETFYNRYIPSLDSWLSFRVPCLSSKPVPYLGPGAPRLSASTNPANAATQSNSISSISIATLPTLANFIERLPDTEILNKWMNDPRVNASWGEAGPLSHTIQFLTNALSSRHSFPVFGCFDGKPFGYFEIYWVKEDKFGRFLGGEVGNWTRGLHCLVGEQDFRGRHRVKVWLSALVHYCWLADMRTDQIMLEPRTDNEKFIEYLHDVGFYKKGEVSFPHKQSAVMKIDRDIWEAPFL
ncbi:hypothetical protein LTS08_005518 [Lithohypha guttulata]|nr:hypothetical protein LTS08_005518 [Lithohypha guttulata]